MPPRLQFTPGGFSDTLERMNANDHFSSSGETTPRSDDVVARLRGSQIFRDYQQAFQTATGLPLVLRAAGSFQEPMHGSKKVGSFCALMAAKSKTCSACLRLQQRAENEAVAAAATLECFAGLSESLVPIRLGDETIAYLQTGQVFLHEPTEKEFRATIRQLAKWKADVDVTPLREAFFQTRVLPRAHYEATVRLLGTFAQHLSMVTNELMIREAAAEPPAVSRARAFIAEHMGEPISLEQVAQSAHMSPFYFCKVFKAAIGLTFTHYLARARVEKTKQLLLNQHTRASEAAFEAGFQSLSQFNRVFRRIVGESPSSYRENLHGATSGASPRSSLAYAA
jgi:AraC-like DNA-binding protein/ligand-binding sensor protein